jgi:AcrR family transcriptional regulator
MVGMASAERTVRDALLDAAYDAAVTTGWDRARMADIASAARVSRQTLYDQFGGREGLAEALALRELGRFLDGTEAAMGAQDEVVAAVEAATVFALTEAAANPLVHAMLTGSDLLPLLTTHAEPVLLVGRGRIADYVLRRWPELGEGDVALAAEVCTRLTLSYVVLSVESAEIAARRVATLVGHLLAPSLAGRHA